MTVGSDNPFPSVLVVEQGSTPTTPASGNQRLFVDSADGLLKLVDDTGTVTPVGGGGGASDLDALLALSGGQDISDALTGAAAPDAGNVFATMADVGGGGGTVAYLGYNTVGGTEETATIQRVYVKKITTSGACLLQGIQTYFRESTDSTQTLTVALCDDNAGALGKVLAHAKGGAIAPTNNSSFSAGASVARWYGIPLAYELAASTSYWLAWLWAGAGTPRQFYDGTGTDRRYDSGGDFIVDGGRYSESTDSRKYSVRALTLG